MARTIEDIKAYQLKEAKKLLNHDEKPGIISRVKNSFAGKVLYAATMVGTLVGVAEYHGAANSAEVKNTVANVTETVSTRAEYHTNQLVKFADSFANSEKEQDIGTVLNKQKQEYMDLIEQEPNNTAAQEELKKLDLLIKTYEQENNQVE